MNTLAIGIDFGTTNSSVARAMGSGEIDLARFPYTGGYTDAYRSLLYLELVKDRGLHRIKSWSGPTAIEEYLAAETKGRLVQSLKSFLSSRSLKSTDVFGRRMTIEDLIARILRDLREKAEVQFGARIHTAVVGRPVRFVGADKEEDNRFAEERLMAAFKLAGYASVEFALEPVAAAHHYESTLDHDELVLIGDFGGGTSDFSLLRVGPGIRKRGRTPADLLGNSGIGLAGDAFDAQIVRNLVSPALGKGSSARSMHKVLPAVPNWVYAKLEHWHHLSFLRTNSVINMLNSSRAEAFEPAKIEALVHLIKEDLGYPLHRAVQKVKRELSENTVAQFRFSDGVIEIESTVERTAFEDWIAEELAKIEACIDALMAASGAGSKDVDMVFLTGGSSFVPAVRGIFEARFGADKIRAGNEFTSVARGLALTAAARRQARA
ncbi:MAG TPA: Hsp70 family protein [Candidatus Acidoferrales bacterium]|nr:Hsp70 family protein [Candidatus Acidoferrales bacterium]